MYITYISILCICKLYGLMKTLLIVLSKIMELKISLSTDVECYTGGSYPLKHISENVSSLSINHMTHQNINLYR